METALHNYPDKSVEVFILNIDQLVVMPLSWMDRIQADICQTSEGEILCSQLSELYWKPNELVMTNTPVGADIFPGEGVPTCGKVKSVTGMPAAHCVPTHQVGPVGSLADQGVDLECPSNQT